MTTLTLRASGAADATQVWQRYAQIACWPEWAPQIRRVDSSAEQIDVGVTGRVVGIAGIGVSFAIDAVDPGARTWSWRVRLGPISLGWSTVCRPVRRAAEPGSGSAVRRRSLRDTRLSLPLPCVVSWHPDSGDPRSIRATCPRRCSLCGYGWARRV